MILSEMPSHVVLFHCDTAVWIIGAFLLSCLFRVGDDSKNGQSGKEQFLPGASVLVTICDFLSLDAGIISLAPTHSSRLFLGAEK